MCRSLLALVSATVLSAPTFNASGAEPKLGEAARRILKKHAGAVVTVQITTVIAGAGAGDDAAVTSEDITGTVVNAEGLTVISLMSHQGFGPDAKVKGAKLILGDGTEIGAKWIGKDDDLDLALLMPSEKTKKLPYITLPKKAQAGLLDETLLLYRMSDRARRPAIVRCRVSAEADDKGNAAAVDLGPIGLGGAIFDSTGNPIGIVTASSSNPLVANPDALIRSGEVIEAVLKRVREK